MTPLRHILAGRVLVKIVDDRPEEDDGNRGSYPSDRPVLGRDELAIKFGKRDGSGNVAVNDRGTSDDDHHAYPRESDRTHESVGPATNTGSVSYAEKLPDRLIGDKRNCRMANDSARGRARSTHHGCADWPFNDDQTAAISSAIIHSTIAATWASTESIAGRGATSGGTSRPISVHDRATASAPRSARDCMISM